jgi:hypothetical protein
MWEKVVQKRLHFYVREKAELRTWMLASLSGAVRYQILSTTSRTRRHLSSLWPWFEGRMLSALRW